LATEIIQIVQTSYDLFASENKLNLLKKWRYQLGTL
jgi:hypothetical protein